MKEGKENYVHYRIMSRLYEQGKISDRNFLEFLESRSTSVLIYSCEPEYVD
jgi:spore cortex formation protein SpoVR/YcgB (stage V sporulation)